MSEISTKTQHIRLQRLDARCIHSVVFLGDVSVVAANSVIDIPKSVRLSKDQSSINEVKSIRIGELDENSSPKWMEKYNINIGNCTAWMKLNGLSSPGIPRPVEILGGVPADRFDDAGVFVPGSPSQSDDSGEASKIVISGVGITSQLILNDVEFETSVPALDITAYGLWPPTNRHAFVTTSGEIFIFMCTDTGAATHARAVILRSTDGGISWTISEIDNSWDGPQMWCSLAADKQENIHFVWTENSTVTANRRGVKYRRLLKDGTWSGIYTLHDGTTGQQVEANIQIQPDGLTAIVIWAGQGYATDVNAGNIVSRTIDSAYNIGAIVQYTTDGVFNTKVYRNPSIEFDTSGYKHINFETMNNTNGKMNLYYLRETGGGYDALDHVNSDDADTVSFKSNILLDKNNNAWMAYSIGGPAVIDVLYIKKITAGTVGARTTVCAGGAGNQGGQTPTIQLNKNNDVVVVYENDSAPFYLAKKLVKQDLSVSAESIMYTSAANYEPCCPQVVWSLSPIIQGVHPNVPQQGTFLVFIESAVADYSLGDLKIVFTPDCILGANDINSVTRGINIRGSISKTKFNNMAGLAIS